MLEKYESSRGGIVVIHEDFIYNIDRRVEVNIRYRCATRSCRGFLLISAADEIIRLGEHNHDKTPKKAEKIKALAIMKGRALSTR